MHVSTNGETKFVINGETKFVMLTLSVDDPLITGDHTEKIESLKPALNKEFAIDINGQEHCHFPSRARQGIGSGGWGMRRALSGRPRRWSGQKAEQVYQRKQQRLFPEDFGTISKRRSRLRARPQRHQRGINRMFSIRRRRLGWRWQRQCMQISTVSGARSMSCATAVG